MTDWAKYGSEMMNIKKREEERRALMTPEEREAYDAALRTLSSLPMEVVLEMSVADLQDSITVREAERSVQLETRREWAAKIREEFGKYHEHGEAGECGACGAIQAANFMDPDYSGDSPKEERG